MPDNDQEWLRCQEALAVEVARVTALLRSLPGEIGGPGGTRGPGGISRAAAKVVGGWNLVEVAVHLSQAWMAIPGLARADLSEFEAVVPDRGAGASLARSVDQLAAVTVRAVAAEPERDLTVLADRIDARARDYLADCAHQDPGQLRPWLITGVTVPMPVFTAHLLNETVLHGWDIARAAGRRWRINPEHAALLVRWFLFEVLLRSGTAMLPDPAKLAAARGRYQLGIRGHQSVRIVLDEHGARLDDEPGPPDCRLSLDPVAFALMIFGRRGRVRTMARGGLLTWGRRPWLALRLQATVPTP